MGEALLSQKTVLITGGSRRIGRALALACGQAGADVIIHYRRSREAAEETRRMLEELGRRVWLLEADLSLPDEVRRLAHEAFTLAPVSALVNNAAIFGEASFAETSLEDWERHLAINLTAPFLMTQAFANALGNADRGRIVNILDWRVVRPSPNHFAYSVSKAALAVMTRTTAAALAPRISVNGLGLGAILPPEGREADAGTIRRVPARRWGTLDEAAQALLFLLSGPAYVTGEVIYVDGGRRLI